MASQLLVLAALVAAPAYADPIVGHPRVVDGDSLVIGNDRVRLHGIDAPELGQHCEGRRRVPIPCGEMARNALVGLVGDQTVICAAKTVDRYRRTVAVCFAGDVDVGREMVRLGWATAFTRYSDDYLDDEAEARAARRGFWGGSWERPADWRRLQPR